MPIQLVDGRGMQMIGEMGGMFVETWVRAAEADPHIHWWPARPCQRDVQWLGIPSSCSSRARSSRNDGATADLRRCGYREGVLPNPAELHHPEFFSCPICWADEGESCAPWCYAGYTRAIYWYVSDDIGRDLVERLQRHHVADEAAKLAASRPKPATPTEVAVEKPSRKRKRDKR